VNRRPAPIPGMRGFTLVEVLVALVIVVIGLAALMVTVSSTARNSGYLRDKTLAQWMALNRLSEVRLGLTKPGQDTDKGQIWFANRTWHYDTRYFDTSIATMKRVVVRVYAGDSNTKGTALAESVGFLGTSIAAPGGSNVDWTSGSTLPQQGAATTTTPAVTAPLTVAPTPVAPVAPTDGDLLSSPSP